MSKQLSVIVKESGLEPSKAKYILENFKDYFDLTDEWSKKAKTIVVTGPEHKQAMALAREGRLFLREKRIAIEKSRKELKEQSLREGKAIDGIANILKALIVPIEEYLDRMEHFVEIEQKKKEDAHRAEVERRMEEERLAEEKRKAEEHEKTRIENERLRKEAQEREKKASEERRKHQARIDAEKEKARKAKEKADLEKRAVEEKLMKEREAAAEKKRKSDEAAKKKLDAERAEKKRLEDILKRQVECPKCHHKFDPQGKNE